MIGEGVTKLDFPELKYEFYEIIDNFKKKKLNYPLKNTTFKTYI